jgi:UDP-N-acetylglucosamine 4-epimerase
MGGSIKILITGGAGFIGSHLVEKYIADPRISIVRVVDDLSNGYYSNIERYIGHPKFEFIKGDICDYSICLEATQSINKVTHQAALGSVPRSIQNPMRSTEVNVLGTVNLLHACVVNGIERIILACSSSTYGDSKELPKVEDRIGKPISPYAVTKFAVEVFADVFSKTYGLNYVGLRYFNIFGPRQNPDNPYAAVIPIFVKSFLSGNAPHINGDGETSRDFTYVDNAVQANDLALFTSNSNALNQVYNVACGEQITLNEIINNLNKIFGKEIHATYGHERAGDVKHSRANISKIKDNLSYQPEVQFYEGLVKVAQWLKEVNETA